MSRFDDLHLYEMEQPQISPMPPPDSGRGWLTPIIPIPLCLTILLVGWLACSEAPTEPQTGVGDTEQIDHNQNHRPPSEGIDTPGDTVCAE